MAPPLLKLEDIRLTFGGTPLLDGASLMVGPGERIALVGRNGSGKSTLLKIAAGMVEPQDGEVFRQPSATVRYLAQAPDWQGYATVRAYVEAGLGPADDMNRVALVIDRLGLTGEEDPATLSGGEARRAALARVLAPEPDLLLLDEPTNHLDLATIEWLEEELQRSSSALVTISHDRRFLERVSRATVWLDRGVTRRLDKGFAHFEDWRDTVLEEEEREQHKLGRQIAREEHWLRYGVTARRKRNVRRLGELQGLREKHRTHRRAEGLATMQASDAAESGKLVIEAKGLNKSYDGHPIVADFSARILRGDRIGFVGPNGAGKTTLINLLIGRLAPDSGTLRLGANLEVAVLDQKRTLDPSETLSHFLTDGRGDSVVVNGLERHVVSYMKDFLFKPEQARTPIRELSGGEKARLVLARLLSRPANLLVLDEPTNDLDMETLDLLQELVEDFPGTVLLVSHDRDFLDRTATSTIAPEGGGRWTEYAGGYSDMMAQRKGEELERRKARGQADAAKGKGSGPTPRPAKPNAQKLSYKQKFALETLPEKIAQLGAEIEALEAKLSDPALYTRDAVAFQRFTKELDEKRATRDRLEEEWLELEMLREEVEG
ncbi:ABC-F family ATP-binding cassette domain-containing protein [Nitratireductor luteus]|uniref:ABC-F family ATP-binding cassette domain-containing protein n=1 Tax=Nitratireductor luteus TaxID=2976980 RepID=UPI00223F909C|nr:ATP-binding cassette domain-containing protein [Nitratireductor luteus]